MENQPKTKKELELKRKLELRNLASIYIDKFISTHPHRIEIKPCFVPTTIPTPKYDPSPKIKTKTELIFFRKSQTIQENEKKQNFTHLNLSQRVEEREKRLNWNSRCSSKSKDRKTENILNFEKLFSSRPFGVHGAELPKFSENCKDYWKLRNGYVENPEIKIKEKSVSRPVSEYSCSRARYANAEIANKPNNVNPFPNFEVSDEVIVGQKRPPSRPRFTQEFYQPLSSKNSQETIQVNVKRKSKSKDTNKEKEFDKEKDFNKEKDFKKEKEAYKEKDEGVYSIKEKILEEDKYQKNKEKPLSAHLSIDNKNEILQSEYRPRPRTANILKFFSEDHTIRSRGFN